MKESGTMEVTVTVTLDGRESSMSLTPEGNYFQAGNMRELSERVDLAEKLADALREWADESGLCESCEDALEAEYNADYGYLCAGCSATQGDN